MKIEELKNKRITVMGLGLHGGGVGTAKFFAEAGARVLVTDLKSKEELKISLEKLKGFKNIEYVFGQHRAEDFLNTDMVIKTPPVPWSNKHIKLALEKKIPVEVDASLFFKLCKNPLIGITGTKGKTTTSSLIYEILKTAGKNPIKVGIGQTSVLDKLKELKKDSLVVFELSSWRLSALGRYGLSPQIAVFTNLLPDHLNYYKSMEDYFRDKKYIFENQKAEDWCVINWDDERLREISGAIAARLIKVSSEKIIDGRNVYLEDGAIFSNDGVDSKKIIEKDKLKIKGNHNIINVMLSVGVSLALGIDPKSIRKALENYTGIFHRLELVKEVKGVKYFNDTAATTPESALSGLDSFFEPIILIAGGSDKNLEMKDLARGILTKTKNAVFLEGKATEKILDEIRKIDPSKKYPIVGSMAEAIAEAQKTASSGDVILLSPGAASFGLFQNEFDRGNQFKEIVKKMK